MRRERQRLQHSQVAPVGRGQRAAPLVEALCTRQRPAPITSASAGAPQRGSRAASPARCGSPAASARPQWCRMRCPRVAPSRTPDPHSVMRAQQRDCPACVHLIDGLALRLAALAQSLLFPREEQHNRQHGRGQECQQLLVEPEAVVEAPRRRQPNLVCQLGQGLCDASVVSDTPESRRSGGQPGLDSRGLPKRDKLERRAGTPAASKPHLHLGLSLPRCSAASMLLGVATAQAPPNLAFSCHPACCARLCG